MAKGTVLMKSKDGEVTRFEDGHPAVELHDHIVDAGGECQPRKMGFKMTDANGGRLGFCVPKKEGYAVYLTTIKHDSPIFEDLDMEVSKGSDGLAVVKDLGKPGKAVKTLKAIYKAHEEAKPEKPPKEKKAKAEKKEKKAKGKAKGKKANGDADGEEKPARKKRRKKAKKDDDESE